MKEKVKKLWLEALRSGKYKQTKDTLKDDFGYCCLGVLCDVYAKTQKKKGFYLNDDMYVFQDGKTPISTVLPDHVMNWAGLTSNNPYVESNPNLGTSLAEYNDRLNYDFNQIADLIEQKL